MPSSGLWEQAKPGWRSAADMQRAEAWRAEANVRREGMGTPERQRGQCHLFSQPRRQKNATMASVVATIVAAATSEP